MSIDVDVYKLPAGIYVLTLILISSINHLNFMRMLQKTIYVLLAFALLLAGGCKESDDNSRMEVSPEPFLGQWQEIARGNETYPELTPDGHVIEFLEDGTMPKKTYHSAAWIEGREETDHYRLDTEFLYLNSDNTDNKYIYRYSFTGTNTLRLDLIYGNTLKSMGIPTFNIYERIKTNERIK
jgi:hypothetical protein